MTTEARIIELVTTICRRNPNWVEGELENATEIREVIRSKRSPSGKTRLLFRPIMGGLSFQGIGDGIVLDYMADHGEISYLAISRTISRHKRLFGPLCEKLENFDSFRKCGYRKTGPSCNNSDFLRNCPVRTHDLLKGVLNVKAYSLYFYIRDLCKGDILARFDEIIAQHYREGGEGLIEAREALVKDFTKVFGVGDKLANMTLSFLLSSDPGEARRFRTGQAMVAIDTLVHNFLHRTGILAFYNADHKYGPGCVKHCLRVLDTIITRIDASLINPNYPKYFPRFVQFSIWHFCALPGDKICNGVNIDDRKPCMRKDICPVYDLCDHIALKPGRKR